MGVDTLVRHAGKLAGLFGVEVLSKRRYLAHQETICRLLRSLADPPDGAARTSDPPGVIIFSKDRPVQLAALLGSMRWHLRGCGEVSVLFHASAGPLTHAYEEIRAHFPAVRFVCERDFRTDVLGLVDGITSPAMFFLVDDIAFTRPVDLGELSTADLLEYVPSLRLGTNLSRCYTVGRSQALPALRRGEFVPGFITWHWEEGEYDWGYPISLDGHLFSTREMRAMLKATEFGAPNSLESALQVFGPCFRSRKGLAFETSRCVNVPNNRVQSEVRNRSGGASPLALLDHWQHGQAIDWRAFVDFDNESCHQEVEYRFAAKCEVL